MKKGIAFLILSILVLTLFAACRKTEVTPQAGTEPQGGNTLPIADNRLEITFSTEDGKEPTVVKAEKNSRIEAPKEPVRIAYTFEGWYLEEKKAEFPLLVKEAVTYTARWTPLPAHEPVIAVQPEEMTVEFGATEGPFVEVIPERGYYYEYQWYYNEKDSNTDGTKIQGANEAVCRISAELGAGKSLYCYCEITSVQLSTQLAAKVLSKTAKLTVNRGELNALIVGSGLVASETIDVPGFLQALADASDMQLCVDSLTKGTNWSVWEPGFTGTNQSEIEKLMKQKKYSFIILQMGRDYVLTTESTAALELKALETVITKVRALCPGAVLILESCPWRQDTNGSTWARYNGAGIMTPEDHKAAIRKYMDSLAAGSSYPVEIADVLSAFEKAMNEGINPYAGALSDFPSAEGAYLTACVFYAEMFKKSPEGLSAYQAVTEKEIADINPDVAAKLQKIAASVVLG